MRWIQLNDHVLNHCYEVWDGNSVIPTADRTEALWYECTEIFESLIAQEATFCPFQLWVGLLKLFQHERLNLGSTTQLNKFLQFLDREVSWKGPAELRQPLNPLECLFNCLGGCIGRFAYFHQETSGVFQEPSKSINLFPVGLHPVEKGTLHLVHRFHHLTNGNYPSRKK